MVYYEFIPILFIINHPHYGLLYFFPALYELWISYIPCYETLRRPWLPFRCQSVMKPRSCPGRFGDVQQASGKPT